MKIDKIINISALMLIMACTAGCNKFLDKEPYSVSPVVFFNSQEQLEAYVIHRYSSFSTGGGVGGGAWTLGPIALRDNQTDNQTGISNNNFWKPGERKVASGSTTSKDDVWYWAEIYNINYFFEHVMPKYEEGAISGNADRIKNSIGEMYFFRAMEYYKKLKSIGDTPIILTPLIDDKEILLESSVRQPRNLVARQILKDLDLAIELLQDNPIGGNTRISKKVALLFKSRVALYEASWERNFKGTAFVPNGEGWPGKSTHPSYAYDADTEINFFLDQAMEAAKIVADATALTDNPASYDYKDGSVLGNRYFEMFGTPELGLQGFPEVLLFKSYDLALNIYSFMVRFMPTGGGTGYNDQYMRNFLMANGLPIYDIASGYVDDDTKLENIKIGRDSRLQLFVQAPGELLNEDKLKAVVPPVVYEAAYKSTTGYMVKKRISHDPSQYDLRSGTIGDIIFRSVEANLNYIEAYYLKNGSIGGDADTYWRAIRRRANVDENYTATIAATDMNEEAKVDLAAYTAGQLIDATLYNIRRERRSEFIAEGFRFDDLKRYRALDQLISKQEFIPRGFNLWEHYATVKDAGYYYDKNGKYLLIESPKNNSNISENKNFVTKRGGVTMEGKYLYPNRTIEKNNIYFDGYTFAAAHYLSAIGVTHLLNSTPGLTSEEINSGTSKIYQNPGWTFTVGDSAQPVPQFN